MCLQAAVVWPVSELCLLRNKVCVAMRYEDGVGGRDWDGLCVLTRRVCLVFNNNP